MFAQGDYAGAEALFRMLASASTGDAVAQYNWGVALARLDRFEDAIGPYRAAITLNPAFADAYVNFAFCLNELGFIAQARQGFAIARALAPEDPVPVLNEGIAALALGDYSAGWQGFAARWRLPAYAKFRRVFDRPVWQGENVRGRTLFLYAEQGFGDSLQMARYLPVLAASGARVIVEMPPALVTLMQNIAGVTVIAKGDAIPDFDFYAAMMDVPAVVGTTLDTIPAAIPYLAAEGDRIAFYHNLSPRKTAFRVGLSWAGRASHEKDRDRSLKFMQLAPLLQRRDIDWVSLQRLVPEVDDEPLRTSNVLDWGRAFSDFAAAAAAISTLDLVIAVDSAVAHLAGALGKPVWVLLPFYADWRWLIARADSPWYPTARLFRQKKRGDWRGVIEDLASEIFSLAF